MPSVKGKLYLLGAIKLLAACGVTRLMVEAGPTVAAAFVRADLVDEAVLFRSPSRLGQDAIDALDGLPLSALTRKPGLKSAGSEEIGVDTVETFERG